MMKHLSNSTNYLKYSKGILLLIVILLSCSGPQSEKTKDQDEQDPQNMEVAKKKLQESLDDAVKKADDKIAELNEQIDGAPENVKYQLETAIREIRKERQKIIDKAYEVANASEDNWGEIKSDAEDELENTRSKIDSLSNRMKTIFGSEDQAEE